MSSTYYNQSCEACLCRIASNSLVLNCFLNTTCEVFSVVPLRYRLAAMNGAKMIFPTGVLPNISRCCQPNLTDVLIKLQNATPTTVFVNSSRCIILTDHGSIVTPDNAPRFLQGFDATTFMLTMQLQINICNPNILSQHAGAYYLGLSNSSILVIDMNDLKLLNIISSSALNGVRDIIFLDGGETMVVASTGSNCLSFFKQVNGLRHNYTFFYNQSVNYANPHGLLYVNDSFFYATGWLNNTMHSYEKVNETLWKRNAGYPYVSLDSKQLMHRRGSRESLRQALLFVIGRKVLLPLK